LITFLIGFLAGAVQKFFPPVCSLLFSLIQYVLPVLFECNLLFPETLSLTVGLFPLFGSMIEPLLYLLFTAVHRLHDALVEKMAQKQDKYQEVDDLG
jgi:hypothetical protein